VAFSGSVSSGAIHATYSRIHLLNRDLLGSSVQELCVVGCRYPKGMILSMLLVSLWLIVEIDMQTITT
jgi:hypothetical protein